MTEERPSSEEEEREEAFAENGTDSPESRSGRKKDVGIFVFLAIMALLIIGAIAFVIYVCSGTASGCNCGKC